MGEEKLKETKLRPDTSEVPSPPTWAHHNFSARQKEILDGLERIITRDGFRSLRLTAVTKDFNTSFATLYLLAPSRDELVALVVERWYQRFYTKALADLARATDPTSRLKVWMADGIAGAGTSSRAFWRDAYAHAAIRAIVDKYTRYYADVLHAILDTGIEQGAFRPVNTTVLASTWELAAKNLADPDFLKSDPYTVREIARDYVDIVLNGLLAD
ncbi:MAG: hypothetical protein CK429_34555 [Mycobacterium sp.]|nr:MAG: hypothetical protein CK429_34555 [Mycobacterium sp.]PJE24709.1 MAG: hypothetical protein CK431_04580 [Mycobacterium sp.]